MIMGFFQIAHLEVDQSHTVNDLGQIVVVAFGGHEAVGDLEVLEGLCPVTGILVQEADVVVGGAGPHEVA